MKKQHGFSLVELMVAMSIGLFLVLLVTGVYLATWRSLNFRQGQGENLANSRYVLDTLGAQLARAGWRRDPGQRMVDAFPPGARGDCAFEAGQTIARTPGGALCIRWQQRDAAERDCSGTAGNIPALPSYAPPPAGLGIHIEKYWVTAQHKLVCNVEENHLADGVQAIAFEYGSGARASQWGQARAVEVWSAGDIPGGKEVRALRYAVLLAADDTRIAGGMASSVCARWQQAGGDSNACQGDDRRLYQLALNALTLRNLMP